MTDTLGSFYKMKAKKAAVEIRHEAEGRVCKDCTFFMGTCCSNYYSTYPNENALISIYRENAVACFRFRPISDYHEEGAV